MRFTRLSTIAIIFLLLTLMSAVNVDAESNTDRPVKKRQLPQGFVYLDEVIPNAQFDLRYYGENNFVGKRIDGYKAPFAILSAKAANALKAVNDDLGRKGYTLKIFDAYRPQKAVDHFKKWAKDAKDVKMQKIFYPKLDKKNLFNLGFLASRSAHSRGSAVDLTLVDIKTGDEADMGGTFDFFGDVSHHGTKLINAKQTAKRDLLKNTMTRHGFLAYSKEWWHYSLKSEPFPKRYFNFDIQ